MSRPVLIEDYVTKACPMERIVLRELIAFPTRSSEDILAACYGHREDGGPLLADDVLRHNIWRLRTQLRPGFQIRRRPPFGYSLEISEPGQ